ncbi:hypothetical protein DL98DRAFT_581062 [Cadophora sp. DSE1049]|nr:hypothetical protein DL98DRAFT_581062 [Cadophora sp. DSE1049]
MASASSTSDGASKPEVSALASTQHITIDFSSHSQTMVTFIVGAEPDKQSFLVHKHLASAHSSFFKAAFESPMVEGTTQTMRLEDVEVETFGVLVHWMYTGEIKAGLGSFTNDKGAQDYDLTKLAKVWKLAERVLMPRLQNATIIDMFINRKLAGDGSLVKVANFVFPNQSEPPSNLRKLIFQLVAFESAGARYERNVDLLPYILLRQISISLSRIYGLSKKGRRGCLGIDGFTEHIA